MRITCFITSHGFGHATRSFSVLSELAKDKKIQLNIISTLPKWFIHENLKETSYQTHHFQTDVGMVQETPFKHSLNDTKQKLNQFLKFNDVELKSVTKVLDNYRSDCFFCDISPLGLYLGRKMGIPSCLLENFTWDWIYEGYEEREKDFSRPIEKLKEIYSYANLHIQTSPVCRKKSDFYEVNPIFRTHKKTAEEIHEQIGNNFRKPVFLITTGGISQEYSFQEKIKKERDFFFILTGNFKKVEKQDNFCLLPHRNKFHFPDLVNCADGIIGKVGYGTLAEAWGSQKPLMGVFRKNFRESEALLNFALKNLPLLEISNEQFQTGEWIKKIKELREKKSKYDKLTPQNGKEETVKILRNWIKNRFKLPTSKAII